MMELWSTWRRDCAAGQPLRSSFARWGLAAAALLAACSQAAAQLPFPETEPPPKPSADFVQHPGQSALLERDSASLLNDTGPSESGGLRPGKPIGSLPATVQPISGERLSVGDLVGAPISEVRVEGNRTIPTYAITRLIESTRAGRPVVSEQILEDKRRLINTHWFISVRERVESSEDGPVVVFEVVERPILRSVTFIGNNSRKFKSERLHRETGLVPNHGFDVAANHEAVARIRQLYHEAGYVHAKVELRKGGNPEDRDVVIVIDEGPKVAVRRISFEGNRFVSGPVLKTKLSTKSQWFMLFGGTYNPASIQSDTLALQRYYEGLGFFDVSVTARESVSDDREHVHVTFEINEGVRYRVRNVEVSGNSVLTREKLLSGLRLGAGEPFNARFLREDAEKMKALYDDLGRPFAEVQPVPRFLEEPGQLDLVYHVAEDQPLLIGRINIRINGDATHTRTDVVRHRINKYLKPGAPARSRDLQAARLALHGDPIVDRESPPEFNIRRVDGTDYLSPTHFARGQSQPVAFRKREQLTPATLTTKDVFDAQQGDTGSLWDAPGTQSWFGQPKSNTTARPTPQADVRAPEPVVPAGIPDAAERFPDAPQANQDLLPPLARARREVEEVEPEVVETRPGGLPPDVVFRAQSEAPFIHPAPGIRAQSIGPDGLPDPQNYLYGNSPQGDPFGSGPRGPLPPPPPPGFVDVDVNITEGRTGRLMFGAGVNSDAGLVGSFVFQEDSFDITAFPDSWDDITQGRAFRGGGQSFRLELIPGTEVSRYNISWRDPYIFGTDYSFGVDAFYYNRYFENWTEDRAGGRLSLGYAIDRHWSYGLALRMENVEFRDFVRNANTPQMYLDVAGSNFLSTGQVRISHDTRDSAFLPSSGHYVELAYEQAFGEFVYPRVELSGNQYFTLYERPDGGGKHILELRGQTIWTGDDTPVFERLFAGGFQSFRGFEFRGVAPRQNRFRIGGEFMAVGTVQYVFPLTAGDAIRGVVFSDFGTVDTDVTFRDFRVTAGAGFRISVPALGPAPIAIDFAFPISSELDDDEQMLSFYVGTNW